MGGGARESRRARGGGQEGGAREGSKNGARVEQEGWRKKGEQGGGMWILG